MYYNIVLIIMMMMIDTSGLNEDKTNKLILPTNLNIASISSHDGILAFKKNGTTSMNVVIRSVTSIFYYMHSPLNKDCGLQNLM